MVAILDSRTSIAYLTIWNQYATLNKKSLNGHFGFSKNTFDYISQLFLDFFLISGYNHRWREQGNSVARYLPPTCWEANTPPFSTPNIYPPPPHLALFTLTERNDKMKWDFFIFDKNTAATHPRAFLCSKNVGNSIQREQNTSKYLFWQKHPENVLTNQYVQHQI